MALLDGYNYKAQTILGRTYVTHLEITYVVVSYAFISPNLIVYIVRCPWPACEATGRIWDKWFDFDPAKYRHTCPYAPEY